MIKNFPTQYLSYIYGGKLYFWICKKLKCNDSDWSCPQYILLFQNQGSAYLFQLWHSILIQFSQQLKLKFILIKLLSLWFIQACKHLTLSCICRVGGVHLVNNCTVPSTSFFSFSGLYVPVVPVLDRHSSSSLSLWGSILREHGRSLPVSRCGV